MKSQHIRICLLSLKFVFPEQLYGRKKTGLKLMIPLFYIYSSKNWNEIKTKESLWSKPRKIIKVRVESDEYSKEHQDKQTVIVSIKFVSIPRKTYMEK